MHLKQFSAKGFKNCRQQIVLEEMGAICVIHGENNIGKSNVLEAIQLFFQLLTVSYRSQPHSLGLSQNMASSEIELLGFTPANIFNLEFPEPIALHATLSLEEDELKEAGLEKLLPTSDVQIRLELKQVLGKFKYQLTQFQFADGTDVTQQQASAEQKAYAAQVAVFMAQSASLLQTANTSNRFVLIGIDRHISSTEREATRRVVPQTLCLQLYDAKESREASYRKRWKLFVHTLQKFNDVLGDGEFTALFDRKAGRADLGFESLSSVFTPLEMLGSGIQQVVALIARLLISDASFVAIEEPELNLRYTLQLRLREIIHEIVAAPVGPCQIFLTSHSPAFEFGEHFYAMRTTENGPVIERRSIQLAESFTQHITYSIPATANKRKAALCYVSNEGLVLLPERIRQQLGVEQGGGITLLGNDNGHVELLNDDQFYDLVEPISNEQE